MTPKARSDLRAPRAPRNAVREMRQGAGAEEQEGPLRRRARQKRKLSHRRNAHF